MDADLIPADKLIRYTKAIIDNALEAVGDVGGVEVMFVARDTSAERWRPRQGKRGVMGDDAVKMDNARPCADDAPASVKDGVYLRYKDGREEWFDGTNIMNDVVDITVRLGECCTCIAKYDVECFDEGDTEFPLLRSSDNDTEDDRKAFIKNTTMPIAISTVSPTQKASFSVGTRYRLHQTSTSLPQANG